MAVNALPRICTRYICYGYFIVKSMLKVEKTENIPHAGYYQAAQRASLVVSGAMIVVAFFIFMAVDIAEAKTRTTAQQGRVYMGQDGLVLETYSGEIYFLRGGNMGQYEGQDVKVEGFLKQDETGLSLLTVKNCEVISGDDQYGEDAEDEEDSASGAFDSAGPAVKAGRGAR